MRQAQFFQDKDSNIFIGGVYIGPHRIKCIECGERCKTIISLNNHYKFNHEDVWAFAQLLDTRFSYRGWKIGMIHISRYDEFVDSKLGESWGAIPRQMRQLNGYVWTVGMWEDKKLKEFKEAHKSG